MEPNSNSKWSFMVCSLVITSTLLAFSCKAPQPRSAERGVPAIRVGIVEERESVEFKIDSRFTFRNHAGGAISRNAPAGHWRIEVFKARPADFQYRLAVGTTKDRYEAEEIADFMSRKGLSVETRRYRIGGRFALRYLHKIVYQVVLRKAFRSEVAARAFRTSILDQTNSEIVRWPKGKARGTLRFSNLDTGDSFDARETVRLDVPRVEVADVDVGSGFHWERSERRTYSGTLEFVLDATGHITVVNELSLENYIRGVVPSEMPASFPFEALKAQAVTARVEALAKIGLRHPVQAFDLCDDVHCQAFSGTTKHSGVTDRAVSETRGLLMVHKNKLTEAFYAGVCGGHTENNDNVWIMNAKPFLRGVPDRKRRRSGDNLKNERNLKRWLDRKPAAFCNTTGGKIPASVNYSKKYFRWRVEYTRSQLERIIRRKTGEAFGNLKDLRPVERGVSGRLIQLEIVGTKRRFTIGKELAIRQALSDKTLFSASFYVEKKGQSSGLPAKFVLHGGGWGHGVGMCQVGAAVMAHRGHKFDQILTHYYQGVFLDKLYR